MPVLWSSFGGSRAVACTASSTRSLRSLRSNGFIPAATASQHHRSDLGAGRFPEQHAVANFDVDRDEFAAFVATARSDRKNFSLLRLFLRVVRNDDASGAFGLGLDAFDQDRIVKRTEFHRSLFGVTMGCNFDPTESTVLRNDDRNASSRFRADAL
jgi:hypothetical protein